jgi:hypothetical protein
MQSSLPTQPTDQNIKAADLAKFVEIAKIVEALRPSRSHSDRGQSVSHSGRGPPIPRNGLAIGPGVLNDPFFRGGLSMGNPKIAIVAYCLAVGFILAVALHSQSKTLATADLLAERPAAPTKVIE